MAFNKEYTTKDTAGFEVKKGDQVTIAFTGEVRSVSRDGMVMVKCADGTLAGFYPNYQAMHKIHPSIKELIETNSTSE